MALTSEIKEKDIREELTFPKLMIYESENFKTIVLFSKSEHGVVVNSNFYSVGHYMDNWIMPAFKDFHGTVKLKQD